MNQVKAKGSFCQRNGIFDYLAEEISALIEVYIQVYNAYNYFVFKEGKQKKGQILGLRICQS